MNLPRQVQEQNERTEKLIQQIKQPDQQPQDVPLQDDTAPPPSNDQAPPDQPAQPGQDRKEREDWKAKYHVLQGKFNAEVPRYAAEVRTLRDRLDVVEKANAELRQQAASQPPAPDPGLDKLRNEYGDDVVGTIERLAEQKVADRLKPIQDKIEESEAERQKKAADDERARRSVEFAQAVNELVPDWEVVDKLPAFHEFLAEPGVDGRSRQELLMGAASRFDAAGAARIFVQFKQTEAFKATQQVQAPPSNPPTNALERQVVPDPTGRDRQVPTQGKTWSRAEIKAVYHDIAMGKYAHDPEKARSLEQEIESALREGRVGK